jgi:hypothetical protein
VGLDESLGDGKPDARSSMSPIPSGVNPVEALEDMGEVLGRDTLAGVYDG